LKVACTQTRGPFSAAVIAFREVIVFVVLGSTRRGTPRQRLIRARCARAENCS
jgi:hypothetical protein